MKKGSKKKLLNITSEILPYIQGAFDTMVKIHGKKFDLKGYTLSAFEFNEYHKYCPYGFDLEIDTENKRIRMDVCAKNDGINMGGFRECIFEEIESHFLGYTIPVGETTVDKTEYDLPI